MAPNEAPGQPLYATPRDLTRPTDGARIAVVAEATGTPLMPWQRYAADVATERNPDGSYRYELVVITVPRQSGKTTLIRAVNVERCVSQPGAQCFYTAQTGKDGRERWADGVKALRSSPFRDQIKVRDAQGRERVIFPNGSEWRCFAPVDDALHGYTPPLVTLDEAMAHDAATGDALMGAIDPAQQTLHRRQLWVVSTAGTARSTFLRGLVDRGRAADRDVCLIEYAAPDDADPYDPETWRAYHPALGWIRPDGTPQVTEETLAKSARQLPRAEFERAYLNRWTVTSSQLIPDDVWRKLTAELGTVPASSVVLCYDVAHDRRSASVSAVWRVGDELRARVVVAQAGSSWVAPMIAELWRAERPRAVAARDGGPAREVTDQLRRDGVRVSTVSPGDWPMATGAMLTAIRDGSLRHDGSAWLSSAAAGVVVRPTGDGIAFSGRHSVGDVSPILGITAGAWVLDHQPRSVPPLIISQRAS